MKVLMLPHPKEGLGGESGIRRVVEAYHSYLPEFGIQLVNPDAISYDLKAVHAGMTGKDCDVAHTHGLYFTADYAASDWEWGVNAKVIEAIRYAKAVTVPSAWVGEIFQRDMHLTPYVLPHGINWKEWQHKEENQGYVLWNKNRKFDVCSNDILTPLAKEFSDVTFVATLSPPNRPDNVKITESGVVPHNEMKQMVQRAGVYLSITKETFGIGVLEAMASGVPVLGWDFGGNKILVKHGINGYLAVPNNFDDLCDGLDFCLKYRDVLGINGQELVRRWTWEDACRKVAGVYRLVLGGGDASVSVVIPVFNKSIEQVKRAIGSCLRQTLKPERIIVVNDGSDQSYESVEAMGAQDYYPVEYVEQLNQGVAHARNNGITLCSSKYICCLDADDWIELEFLSKCVSSLENNTSLGIAYTGLRQHNPDGSNSISSWPNQFDCDRQLNYDKRMNQVPTCCVFRKNVWERVGGYRQRYAPRGAGSEDAAFWAAIVSFGYGAEQVTKEPLFNYSAGEGVVHSDPQYRETDWLGFYPWAKDKQYPFAACPTPKNHSHAVRQYDEPTVSIVIPVGPGHEKLVFNALDSIEMQSFRIWEVIVIWDGCTDLKEIERIGIAYPYIAKQVVTNSKGAGYARNRGVEFARAPLIFFLDADDMLSQADSLEIMIKAWNQEQKIIYSDYIGKATWDLGQAKQELGDRLLGFNEKTGQAIIRYHAADYDCEKAIEQPKLDRSVPTMPYYLWCTISILMPKAWHQDIDGFDEKISTWEDTDYMWRLAKSGYCFHRVEQALLLYNFDSGHRREKSIPRDVSSRQKQESLVQYIREKYKGLEMVGCGCGGSKKKNPVVETMAISSGENTMSDGDYVEIEFHFVGSQGTYGRPLKSPTGQRLPGGKIVDYNGYSRRKGEIFLVHKEDQKAKSDMFRLVKEKVKIPEVAIEPIPEPSVLEDSVKEPLLPVRVISKPVVKMPKPLKIESTVDRLVRENAPSQEPVEPVVKKKVTRRGRPKKKTG